MTDARLPADIDFALCLTHDVDRPSKTYQCLYEAVRERSLSPLRTLVSRERPYWQFDAIVDLESSLGVRSAFYFLDEPSQLGRRPLTHLRHTKHLTNHLGRYDVDAPEIRRIVRHLDRNGWEVGLHGSSVSYRDEDRLRAEKRKLGSVLGHPVAGVRQHYLHLDVPRTWQYHARAGLRYDTSLGSSTEYGFDHGYHPIRPFDDDFVVFPLTLMETALPDPATEFDAAHAACERLLDEAAVNGAVMTALWHQRFFNDREFTGYRRLYRRLVEGALDRGAWVGPPGELYDRLHPADTTQDSGSTNSAGASSDDSAGAWGGESRTNHVEDGTDPARLGEPSGG